MDNISRQRDQDYINLFWILTILSKYFILLLIMCMLYIIKECVEEK